MNRLRPHGSSRFITKEEVIAPRKRMSENIVSGKRIRVEKMSAGRKYYKPFDIPSKRRGEPRTIRADAFFDNIKLAATEMRREGERPDKYRAVSVEFRARAAARALAPSGPMLLSAEQCFME